MHWNVARQISFPVHPRFWSSGRLISRPCSVRRDGWDKSVFHKNCDDKQPTLVVTRAKETRRVFGGYTTGKRLFPLISRAVFLRHASTLEKRFKVNVRYGPSTFISCMQRSKRTPLLNTPFEHFASYCLVDLPQRRVTCSVRISKRVVHIARGGL